MVRRSPKKLSDLEEGVRLISQVQIDPFLSGKRMRSDLASIQRAKTKKPKPVRMDGPDDPAVAEQLKVIREQLNE